MKAVKITLARRELYLLFNSEAMFQIQDQFGGTQEMLTALKLSATREGFAALCKAVTILAEQGELTRRFLGYDTGRIFTAEELERIIMPTDMVELSGAVMQAITLGYGREIEPENNEIDLDLAELTQSQKKTT